ncbi:MAG: hypothetical protein HKN76_09620 [Saprospiraceae bacterium]|nr:hypothetical protein [Saprospiraceae bacterium]
MTFSIHTIYGEWYYLLFYQLSLMVAFLIFIGYGIWKKHPLFTWILIGFNGLIFFFIGSKLGAMNMEELIHFLTSLEVPHSVGQTDIFGFLLGILGLLVAKRILRFQGSVFDVYAVIIPIGIIVQRLGCVMAGCCYGTITTSPLALRYAPHFTIYDNQVEQELITSTSSLSLPVHPIPIYIIVSAFLILFLLYRYRHRVFQPGALLLISMTALLTFRFFLEFIRAPETNHFMGEVMYGLKIIQWLLVVVVMTLLSILLFIESRNKNVASCVTPSDFSGLRHTVVLLIIVEGAWLVRGLLEPQDVFIMMLRFLIASVVLMFYYRSSILGSRLRYVLFLLFVGSLIWMGQTFDRSADGRRIESDTIDQSMKKVVKYIQANAVFGSPKGIERKYRGSGCDRELIENNEYAGKFSSGIWYGQVTKKSEKKDVVFGIGSNYSQYSSINILEPSAPKMMRSSISIGAYFGGDEKRFGYKFGGHFGDMRWINPTNFELQKSLFFPIVQVRLGSLGKIYGKFGFGDDFTQGVYGTFDRYLLGINLKELNSPNDQLLEFGVVNLSSWPRKEFYVGGRFSINQNWILIPSAQLGNTPYFGLGVGSKFD